MPTGEDLGLAEQAHSSDQTKRELLPLIFQFMTVQTERQGLKQRKGHLGYGSCGSFCLSSPLSEE